MTRMRRWVALFVLSTAACGADAGGDGSAAGSAGLGASGGASGSGPAVTGGAAGSGGASGSAGEASGGDAGASASGGAPAQTAALPALGSLVVLGDSLSDGGGQGPYYYNLLRQDLTTKYGAIEYRNVAQGGSKTGALAGQIDSLPNQLPGPVAVAITSGGNDMKASILQVVAGADAPLRAQMGSNISAALGMLLKPGRFGPGADVHVFEANIYDASDGQGNYSEHDCVFGKGYPAMPTDGYFLSWNGEIASQVEAKGQLLIDLHGLFRFHGFNHPPSWYASDCTHPVSIGHDQLRRLFYFVITGQELP
jgi:hypothetical protein